VPLPDTEQAKSTEWPPPRLASYFDMLGQWSAWYSGDPDELQAIYERVAQRQVPRPRVRPSQFQGGIVGALARKFWGQPIPHGEKRTKLHAPIAGDIASTSADLLFSEPPTLSLKDKAHKSTQDRLDELVDDGIHAGLREGAEVASALGGVYLRVMWDREVRPGPWLSPVHADAAVPSWSYDQLKAVTFWRQLGADGTKIYRWLERHETGSIFHAVYEGTDTKLGSRVPLTEFDETAGLAPHLVDGDRILTGVTKLTAGYVPNMRPNRLWRNTPACAYCGRSDYAGVEGFMDALDEAYTSLMRDVRLAKARLIVPEQYLQNKGPGQGAYFDADRELYEAVKSMPDKGLEMKAQQFDIRVAELDQVIMTLLARILGGAGYSQQTFGLSGDAAATATEITARERKSFITRDRKIQYWRPVLADLLETLLMVDAATFGSKVEPQKPQIQFGDTVSEDPKAVAEVLALLEQARAISTRQKVVVLHPDWEDSEVDNEVELIKEEQAMGPVEDPGSFTGAPSTKDGAENMPGKIPEGDQAEE